MITRSLFVFRPSRFLRQRDKVQDRPPSTTVRSNDVTSIGVLERQIASTDDTYPLECSASLLWTLCNPQISLLVSGLRFPFEDFPRLGFCLTERSPIFGNFRRFISVESLLEDPRRFVGTYIVIIARIQRRSSRLCFGLPSYAEIQFLLVERSVYFVGLRSVVTACYRQIILTEHKNESQRV